MQLTRSGEYALRTMIHLASHNDGHFVNIIEISESRDVPENILRKIVPQLVRAGFVRTIRGRDGGILLNRPPHLINLLDIIECIEGPVLLNTCLISPADCHQISTCTLHNVWREAQEGLIKVLQSKTLADVAQK